jgi:hypothetical protein
MHNGAASQETKDSHGGEDVSVGFLGCNAM